MAYCINCGAQLPDHAKFCNECGAKQEIIKKEQPTEKKNTYQPVFHDIDEEESFYEEKEEPSSKTLPEDTSAKKENSTVLPESNSPMSEDEEFDEEFDEETNDGDEEEQEDFVPKEINISRKPASVKEPEPDTDNSVNFEEDDEYDKEDEENDGADSLLQKLSSYKEESAKNANAEEEKSFPLQQVDAIINDPYWDDVKPEIDNEIYEIDRSVILKGIGCVCALFLVIAYLIYMI